MKIILTYSDSTPERHTERTSQIRSGERHQRDILDAILPTREGYELQQGQLGV